MGIIKRMRKQDCVYWAPTGKFDRNGDAILSAPVDVKCRWVDEHVLFRNAAGQEVVSKAKVYVDRDMQNQGYLKLGTVATLEDVSPFKNTGVYEIQSFEKLPNLRNTEYLRTAML